MSPFVPASLAVAVAQVVKGVTGFGSALVAVPLLALIWGPQEAIFVCAATDLVGGFVLLFQSRRLVSWLLVGAMIPGMFLGQVAGTELLVRLDPRIVAWCLAAAVGTFALSLVLRPVRPGRGELSELPGEGRGLILGQGVAASLAGGLMAGLVGAGGPPVVLFMKHHFEKDFFRAQLIGVFVLGACALCAILWIRGAADMDTLTKVPILLVPMILGNQLGAWMAPRVPPKAFGRIVGLLLLGASAAMVLGE